MEKIVHFKNLEKSLLTQRYSILYTVGITKGSWFHVYNYQTYEKSWYPRCYCSIEKILMIQKPNSDQTWSKCSFSHLDFLTLANFIWTFCILGKIASIASKNFAKICIWHQDFDRCPSGFWNTKHLFHVCSDHTNHCIYQIFCVYPFAMFLVET